MAKPQSYMKYINVLIADPDDKIRVLVRDVLSSIGITNINFALNGEEAIRMLRQQEIDILITDWRMAPIDGIQLIDYIRGHKDSPNPFLPIIMLTGKAERADVMKARDTGVTEFLVKPFTAKLLYERIVLMVENPRSFILSDSYKGPDRRRTDLPPDGIEKRGKPPINMN
jgi:CheY-like chemotaxis protein